MAIKLHERFVGFFHSLARCGIHHPVRVLLIAALVTLAAAPGILRLKLRTDGLALVSHTAPEVLVDKAIRDHFGIHDQLVVLIRSRDAYDIFNPVTLQLVRDLTADFRGLPGVGPADVMSLATEPSFRIRPADQPLPAPAGSLACKCKNEGTRNTAPKSRLALRTRVGMTDWERLFRIARSRAGRAKTLLP
jgi:uncharacterized membrane protein YdfJ with MMPL/SSD domain